MVGNGCEGNGGGHYTYVNSFLFNLDRLSGVFVIFFSKENQVEKIFVTIPLIKVVNISTKRTLNSSKYHIHMHNKKKSRLEEEVDNMLWLWSGECNLKS